MICWYTHAQEHASRCVYGLSWRISFMIGSPITPRDATTTTVGVNQYDAAAPSSWVIGCPCSHPSITLHGGSTRTIRNSILPSLKAASSSCIHAAPIVIRSNIIGLWVADRTRISLVSLSSTHTTMNTTPWNRKHNKSSSPSPSSWLSLNQLHKSANGLSRK